MNWKKHLLWGSIVGLIPAVFFCYKNLSLPFDEWILLTAIILLSPLVCDLDHHNGKLKNLSISLAITALIVGTLISVIGSNQVNNLIIISVIVLSIVNFTPYVFKHRGFIHSISFIIIYATIIGIMTMNYRYSIISFLGAWSHLWLDKIPFKIK